MKQRIDEYFVRNALKKRPETAEKHTVGTLLSVCGSYGMAGAAIMSAKAALRSGIGLLKLSVPERIYPIMAGAVPEAVFSFTENIYSNFDLFELQKHCGAVLCGCGLGESSVARSLVLNVIRGSETPIIFDADALNIISHIPDVLTENEVPKILTPHDREFSRLCGVELSEVKNNREELALEFARNYDVIVVLKGHVTLVASPSGELYFNDTVGNAGMACGGSGDVLAGVISSLVAQGNSPFEAACAGVYIHGLAGDFAKKKFGEISMLPTDTVECLPDAFKRIFGE